MNQYNNEYSGNVNNEHTNQNKPKKDTKIILGIVILVIGLFMLIRATGLFDNPFIDKLISFPLLLVIFGLILGSKENYKMGGWVFLVAAGSFFLLKRFEPALGQYFFPLVIISVGIYVITNQKNKKQNKLKSNDNSPNNNPEPNNYLPYEMIPENKSQNQYQNNDFNQGTQSKASDYNFNSSDFVKMEAIFAGNERIVQTSNFKGGKLVCILGGIKLDCKMALLNEDVYLDVYTICGGIEIIVPANWAVVNQTTTILGNLEDKRRLISQTGNEKKIIITGIVICGGIEIKNY